MLILATGNKHKVAELAAILGQTPWKPIDPAWSVEEGTVSLMDNAILKARSAKDYAKDGEAVLAEDTGLFVPALDGAPGVVSSRYAGDNCSFKDNIDKLLLDMRAFAPGRRGAYFLTVCALALPDGSLTLSCGRLEGEITLAPEGSHGFGYDPVFYCPELGLTLAQAPSQRKTLLSHRTRALKILLPFIEKIR
ncbi:MAG: non-canonical purine NTP pyrophosphatase [Elusimicrobiota bacterium]